MKKLAILFITLLSLVSCHENAEKSFPAKAMALTSLRQSRKNNFSVADMVYKFQIDLAAIYGEAFTNKSWH